MKTIAPQLTPFVRSDAVGSILAELLGHPDREFSLSEVGRRTGVSGPVVHREVGRLIESDVLRDRHQGRNRLVRANEEHPLFALMRDLIAATYGPVPVLRELFDDVDGAAHVFIYGSWAARRAGESGAFPNDIDLLVVGTVPRRTLSVIATEAGERLDIPVNVTRLGPHEWESDEPSPFISTIRSRPIVDVLTGDVHV
ncbi:winged helix-turn-helix transcriptional regulator [Zhihengliuella salsuginis]|uniref:ArsR family transcriptional regulator n=1 Tax=Zhihengliuella salsuginis TaxID=578222 RepID=A0ABQ3GEZ7_9MICC|nr:winged helix-turn-helix transcriptional regulator [Zhihengliuella salsuginis]GHD04036.1 ArsR family transcriptional regulator [Zhihengliuella salsuginis]